MEFNNGLLWNGRFLLLPEMGAAIEKDVWIILSEKMCSGSTLYS